MQVANFVRQSAEELRKIQWPNAKETARLTAYVIGISLAVGLLVMGFDYVFKELLTRLIK